MPECFKKQHKVNAKYCNESGLIYIYMNLSRGLSETRLINNTQNEKFALANETLYRKRLQSLYRSLLLYKVHTE